MADTQGPSGFEGPEKRMEVDFRPGEGAGLRALPRHVWDDVLDEARCKILSVSGNSYMDAYVLSESSLFVYDYKCVLKTCGTTTLLRCLPLLLAEARAIGMELEWLGYSRKNYTFPDDQHFPHQTFTQEVDYAKGIVGPLGEQLVGGAYALGNLAADHWYVYVADYVDRAIDDKLDRNINIMMYELDPAVLAHFFMNRYPEAKGDAKVAARLAEAASGIDRLVPGARIDGWMFEPCGYSMNALLFESYFTIHITPEEEFSYASFETNIKAESYESLLRNVLAVFRPGRFTVTVFADRGADAQMGTPNDIARVAAGGPVTRTRLQYARADRTQTCIATDYICDLANYVSVAPVRAETAPSSPTADMAPNCTTTVSGSLLDDGGRLEAAAICPDDSFSMSSASSTDDCAPPPRPTSAASGVSAGPRRLLTRAPSDAVLSPTQVPAHVQVSLPRAIVAPVPRKPSVRGVGLVAYDASEIVPRSV